MFKFLAKIVISAFKLPLVPYYLSQLFRTKHRIANAELFGTIAQTIVTATAQRFPNSDLASDIESMITDLREQTGLRDVNVAERLIREAISKL